MLASDSNQRLDRYKEVEVDLQAQYKRRDSLILRISNIYLVLTVVNLMVFWVATGSNQVGLITERALYEGKTIGYKLHGRLLPFVQQKRRSRAFLADGAAPKKALKAMRKSLQLSKKNKTLMVENFKIVHVSGKVLAAYPNTKANRQITRKDLQTTLRALQSREQKNEPFVNTPEILDYSMSIAIPLVYASGAEEMVFFTRLSMKSIEDELWNLILLAASMLIFMLAVQGIFGFVLYRTLVRPIRTLVTGAEQVASGNLDVSVKTPKKRDELAQLVYTFNRMVAVINEKSGKLTQSIDDLEGHNKNMQIELDMAQSIQQGIMPATLDFSDMISASLYYEPLEKVSGDYYDLFELPDGSIGILIADASGHGVPAALVTIMAKFHFATKVTSHVKPTELFEIINPALSKAIVTTDYLTAFYMVIHPDLTAEYSNASHQNAIVIRAETGEIEEWGGEGFIIGALDEVPFPYEEGRLAFKPGDRMVLYTDGPIEALNPEEEMFGMDRFKERLLAYKDEPIDEFNKKIMSDVDEFAKGTPRFDDYTILTIEIKGEGERKAVQVEVTQGAEQAFSAGDYPAAAQSFAEALVQDPGNLGVTFRAGQSYFFAKDYGKALEKFEELSQLQGSNTNVLYYVGMTMRRLGRTDEAIKTLERVISIDQTFAEAHIQLLLMYANEGDLSSAEQRLESIEALQPEGVDLLNLRRKLATPTQKASAEVDEVDADSPAARFRLGQRLLGERDYGAAFDHFQALSEEAAGNPSVLYHLGITERRMNRLKDGVKTLQRVVELDPAFLEAHLQLLLIHGRAGNTDIAQQHFDAIEALDPDHIDLSKLQKKLDSWKAA